MKHITIYSTPTCPYCKLTRGFFDENGVKYADRDVSVDELAAQEMIEKTGQLGVPVITIRDDDREDVVVGFQKDRLSKLLGI